MLVCIGVVDVDVDALEPESSIRRRHVASGKTPKRWWSCSAPFAVFRFMGSSTAMIDHHYGHLAHDSRQHAVSLLDALGLGRAVDAAWTSTRTLPKPDGISESKRRRRRSRPRVDALWTPHLALVALRENEGS